MDLFKIVLTGGPCSGKSTCVEYIKEKLEEAGYKVICVSETARDLIGTGIIPQVDYDFTMQFQDSILKLQNMKEKIAEAFGELYRKEQNVVILYDRSILDNAAYLPSQKDFDKLLAQNGLSKMQVTQKYDLVLDLVSVAALENGGYTTDGIRLEDQSFAVELDKKTAECYLLHRNLRIIHPQDDFARKEQIAMDYILELLNRRQSCDNTFRYSYSEEVKQAERDSQSVNQECIRGVEYTLTPDGIIDRRIVEKKYGLEIVYEYEIEDSENDYYEVKNISQKEAQKICKKHKIIGQRNFRQISYIKDYEHVKIRYYSDQSVAMTQSPYLRTVRNRLLIPNKIC